MHLRNLLILCLWAVWLLFPGQLVTGQASGSVSGTVIDAGSGEPLIAVNIRAGRQTGTATDLNGAFSLTLDVGQHLIEFSYVGYSDQKKEIFLGEGDTIRLEIEMRESR